MAVSPHAVLDALGEPSRRLILERLSGGELPVGILASRLSISRPAVSQHLRVLKDAELVSESVAGTRRLYRINPAGLAAVRDYLDGFWGEVLTGFARRAREIATSETGDPSPETRGDRPDAAQH